ncbi:MAG: hypothetical protein GY716_15720 [bacterium]|nr:hypothetical protein [bacterium]
MANFETLYNALRTRFKTSVEDVVPLAVQYDNDPPFGTSGSNYSEQDPQEDVWCRFAIVPGSSGMVDTAGTVHTFRTQGLCRVSVYGPINRGDRAVLVVVDTINEAFRAAQTIDYVVEVPDVSQGRRDGPWWRMDLDCPFFADESAS